MSFSSKFSQFSLAFQPFWCHFSVFTGIRTNLKELEQIARVRNFRLPSCFSTEWSYKALALNNETQPLGIAARQKYERGLAPQTAMRDSLQKSKKGTRTWATSNLSPNARWWISMYCTCADVETIWQGPGYNQSLDRKKPAPQLRECPWAYILFLKDITIWEPPWRLMSNLWGSEFLNLDAFSDLNGPRCLRLWVQQPNGREMCFPLTEVHFECPWTQKFITGDF